MLLLSGLLVAGCIQSVPPAAPSAHQATAVAASFGRTWDAVIDDFAANNIPIRTVERASGFISAEPVRVPLTTRNGYARTPDPNADCGSTTILGYAQPTEATYNVLVRGDSAAATVRATVRWRRAPGGEAPTVDCTTRGAWEQAFEATVKRRAESPATAR